LNGVKLTLKVTGGLTLEHITKRPGTADPHLAMWRLPCVTRSVYSLLHLRVVLTDNITLLPLLQIHPRPQVQKALRADQRGEVGERSSSSSLRSSFHPNLCCPVCVLG